MYPKENISKTWKVTLLTYDKKGKLVADESFLNEENYLLTNRSSTYKPGYLIFPKFRKPTNFWNGYRYFNQPVGTFQRKTSDGGRQIADYGPVNPNKFTGNSRHLGDNLVIYPGVIGINIENRCKVEVLNKLSQSNINIGVAIAEAKMTASLLAKQSIALVRAYTAAKRGRWREVLSQLLISEHRFKAPAKDLGGRWLELQYGWLPLMSDLKASYDLLTQVKLPVLKPLRVKRTVGTVDQYFVRNVESAGDRWSYNDRLSIRYHLWYMITDARLAWAASLGLVNPLEIYWEKTPWSFVVDWFLPVGNLIESLSNPLGLDLISGTATWQLDSKMNATLSASVWSGSAKLSASAKAYDRQTFYSFPTPMPYVKSPFSGLHLANALALINQRLKR